MTPRNIYLRGRVFWIRYQAPDPDTGYSKEYRESGGTEAEAKKLLRQRLGEVYTETFIGPERERVTVGELLDDYCEHLVLAGKKSIHRAPEGDGYRGAMMAQVKPLKDWFGALPGKKLSTKRIRKYIAARFQEMARATVKNEVAVLRAAFRLAKNEGRLREIPHFPGIKVNNARKVFYEPEEVEKIVKALPDPLNDLVQALYLTGRRKMELCGARWEWVDRTAGTLTIPDTKNGDPAIIPLEGRFGALIEKRWELHKVRLANGTRYLTPWIFHRRGKPVLEFAVAFNKARIAAGVPNKVVHDLRRTAIREFRRAGVEETVAMSMSGHRNRDVFRRYDITSVEDKREAMRATERYREVRG